MHTPDDSALRTTGDDPSAVSLLRLLRALRDDDNPRPTIIAVDGRSGSGKSTITRRLAAAASTVSVVSTDDVAWNHSFFDWADAAASGVLEPLRRNALPLAFRPPAWDAYGRTGHLTVPLEATLVLFEGVGSSRREFGHLLDGAVWVDADEGVCAERVRRRGSSDGHPEPSSFTDAWTAAEQVFLAADLPWERADIVVRSTDTDLDGPLSYELVRLGPLS